MATWLEVRDLLERYLTSVERLGDEICRVRVLVKDAGNTDGEIWQQVYVHRCEIPANDGGSSVEFIGIDAPVAAAGTVDVMKAIAIMGSYNTSVLSYMRGRDGYLSAGTRILAGMIDVSNPAYLTMAVYFVGSAAYQLERELIRPSGQNAEHAAAVRPATWKKFRELVLNDPEYTIERDSPDGDSFIFLVEDGGGRKYRLFATRNDQDFGGPDEEYLGIEYCLGNLQEVDLRRAAEAAVDGIGGVICLGGSVYLRVTQNLTALTVLRFKMSVVYLMLAAERYEGMLASD